MTRSALALAVLVPAVASAQAPSEMEKALRIPAGQVVRLTLEDGRKIEGPLQSSKTEDLVRRGAVVTIEKRDSVREGALVGAAVVGVPALFAGPTCLEKSQCTWAPTLVAAGAGALIGALIDGRTPWKVVYRRPGRPTVSPVISRGSVGVSISF